MDDLEQRGAAGALMPFAEFLLKPRRPLVVVVVDSLLVDLAEVSVSVSHDRLFWIRDNIIITSEPKWRDLSILSTTSSSLCSLNAALDNRV